MGKAEVGTPKWIGNKIKAKGLQKLRWYCQMCQKQCRDENGFKCHTMSESHQRQLLIFADTPHKFLDSYSKEFQDDFLTLLKRTHGTKRVFANTVYKEYIGDRHHVHMNSTKWVTLTGFVKHLGRAGHCVVDETEKGWYITWIDRDPETIARQEALKKKEKAAMDDEERLAEFIKTQVNRDHKEGEEEGGEKFTELQRSSEEEKIQLKTLKLAPKKEIQKLDESGVFKKPIPVEVKKRRDSESSSSSSSSKRKLSALEEIKMEEEERKRKFSSSLVSAKEEPDSKKDYWLKRNIVVKIITKRLGDKYYKQKGYIKEVVDKYTAVVVLLSSGAKLKLDQIHLETVVPALDKEVLILKGENRGDTAILEELDIDNFCAHVKINKGPDEGRKIKLPYEHFSKIYTE